MRGFIETTVLIVGGLVALTGIVGGLLYFQNQEPIVGAPNQTTTRDVVPFQDSKYHIGSSTQSLAYLDVYTDGLLFSTTSSGCLQSTSGGRVWITGSDCGTGAGGDFAWTTTGYGVSTGTTLGFTQGFISTASSTITGATTHANDVFISNNNGMVVGHTSQITTANTHEFQVLGSGTPNDSGITIGRWSLNTGAPHIDFVKSRNGTIGSHTIVQDADEVFRLSSFPDDGVDFATEASRFVSLVDDASPAAGDIGMAFAWDSMQGGGGALREKMRLDANGDLGIGTTSPYARLSVVGETVAEYFTATSTTATSTLPRLSVQTGANLFGTYGQALSDFCISITGGSGLCDGTDATGSGTGNVSTSTVPTVGHIPYWTSSGATPETVGSVATSSITYNSPLTTSGTAGYIIGGSSFTLDVSTSTNDLFSGVGGNILSYNNGIGWLPIATSSINVGTASALAANGANCSSGNAPLGVDASGAVESCFDVWTEAENTAAAYIALTDLSASAPIRYNSGTGAFSWFGLATTSQPTAGQLLYSNGGAGLTPVSTSTPSLGSNLSYSGTLGNFVGGSSGSLSIDDVFLFNNANDTTSGILTMAGLVSNASSTFTASTTFSSTATTTIPNLRVNTSATLFGTYGTALSDFCIAITGGSGLCDGTDATGSGAFPWTVLTGFNATSSALAIGTSTAPNARGVTSLTVTATSTNTVNLFEGIDDTDTSVFQVTDTGEVLTANGDATNVGIGFISNPSTGIYTGGTNLEISVNGTNSVDISDTLFQFNAGIDAQGGLSNTFFIEGGSSGAESAPTYSFRNDADTGIWGFTDNLGIGAGGVEFITLVESTQDELVVNEDGDDIDFRVETDTDTDTFFIEGSTNKVGLGTTSPRALLTVGSTTPTVVSGYRDAFFAGDVEIDGVLTLDSNFTFDGTTHTATSGVDPTLISGTIGTTNAVLTVNADDDLVEETNGLTWNITPATCTGDGNGGALTVSGTEIVCSADDGGAGSSQWTDNGNNLTPSEIADFIRIGTTTAPTNITMLDVTASSTDTGYIASFRDSNNLNQYLFSTTSTFTIDAGVGVADGQTRSTIYLSSSAGGTDYDTYMYQDDTGIFSFVADPDNTVLGFSSPGYTSMTTNQFRITSYDSVLSDPTAPPYSWLSDTNTGMFLPTSDRLGFSAGGIEFLRLNETTQDDLTVNENGVDIDFRVESVGVTNSLFVDGADGGVTLGTITGTANNCLQVDTNGLISGTGSSCGGSGSPEFNFATTYATTSAATSSSIWSQGGVFYSSSTIATSTFPNFRIDQSFQLFTEIWYSLADFLAYLDTSLTTLSNLVTVGALNSGSITSGFGNIDIGSSNFDADGTITSTGVIDFGGATSFELPNGTAPTVNATGEIALDTTSNNIILATTTTNHIVVASATTTLYAFSGFASTSPDFRSGGIMDLPSHPLQQHATKLWCKADGGTSVQIFLSDGTNDTNTITCTTTGTEFALTTNNIFTSYEAIRFEIGTVSGTVDYLSARVMGYRTSD